jgi:general secretion pathway protein D
VVPVDSSNAIALRGDATSVSRFAAMARELDKRAESGAEIRVYPLEYANAETLLPTIRSLIGETGSESSEEAIPPATAANASPSAGATTVASVVAPIAATGSASALGGRGKVVVSRYEGSNAIIIAASADVQKMLGELIRQLDTRPQQVLVEAIVVEIGNDAAKRLGVQFLVGGKNAPFAATNYSNAVPNILTIGGAVAAEELASNTTTVNGNVTTTTQRSPLGDSLQQAAAQSLLNATGGFGGLALDIGNDAIFGTIINAVQNDTESNILATPHIVTLNNQKAKFLVGQDVPITTGEALSGNFDNAFRTVQRKEVGIKLEVMPQVNQLGEVKLFVRQEVSSVAGPVSNRSSDLIFNKREFETTLTVGDGQILAIGGLLNDDERRTIEKIPLLSDIPLLGELFKSKSRTRRKTNLTVFIRPTVIRSRADGDAHTARRYDYVRNLQLDRNPDTEPSIDQLFRDYMGTVPPVAPTVSQGDVLIGASTDRSRTEDGAIQPLPESEIQP